MDLASSSGRALPRGSGAAEERRAEEPPGLPPGCELPPTRQTARWVMRPLAFLEELRARHGDVFTIRLAREPPWVMVSDPELLKRVFQAPADVLHAGEGKRVLEPILGLNSLLLLDGERHMTHRKLLLPSFHGDRVKLHEAEMRAVTEAEIARRPAGVAEPAAVWMRAIALEVIVRAVFGVSGEQRRARMRDALHELNVPANADEARAPAFLRARERVDELVYEEIARHREDPDLRRRDDVLSLLLQSRYEDGAPMADVEVRDELMTLLVAGHETTATTLAWALERLARAPAAMARTVAEAEAGGGPYTDAVIRETLRMRPALPMVARVVKQPFELGRWTIQPGTIVAPSILLVHHRADVYPEPGEFRPERFLERKPGTYTWLPFGGGVRRCIGAGFALLQMRAMLSTLLARARVRVVDPEPEPLRTRAVTLTPGNGAVVAIEPLT
jgi:cytochrome P450 family 135